jgi:hypothetical protein
MRRFRAPVDPHLDPLRAPSARGQHPHVHRIENEVKNPQNMYEQRQGQGADYRQMPMVPGNQPRPVGQVTPPPPSLLDNPLVVFGLGALAVYALAKLTEKDETPRQNPAPAPAPPQSVVVVSPPPGVPVQTVPAQALPAPGETTVDTTTAAATVKTPAKTPAPAKRSMSEEQKKKLRERAATQERYKVGEKKGQFKPKRTRKK